MRVKLIEDLPMATSAELYQLSWVIEQLMADPRRIVQARSQLHMGQLVQGEGKLRPGRIVSMKDRQVTLLDEQSSTASTCRMRRSCSMTSRPPLRPPLKVRRRSRRR